MRRALRKIREMVEGFFADLDVVGTEAALAIGERALHQAGDVGFGERLQLEDQRAREQGAVDAEIWILSGGADEMMVPFSTDGRSPSCCALLKR